jgi:hypothetical protein
MTKGEMRQARKAARAKGDKDPFAAQEFTETARGYRARDRWARRYDALNGAPEGAWDR